MVGSGIRPGNLLSGLRNLRRIPRRHASALPLANPATPRLPAILARASLASVALILCTIMAWSGTTAYRANLPVRRAAALGSAHERSHDMILAEAAEEHELREAPGPETQARFQTAAASVRKSLGQVRAFADPEERPAIDELAALQSLYERRVKEEAGDAIDDVLARLQLAVSTAARYQAVVVQSRRDNALHQAQLFACVVAAVAASAAFLSLLLYLVRARFRIAATQMAEAASIVEVSERRFRGLLLRAPETILVCAAPGTVTYENAALERRWGYRSGALVGQSLRALVHPADTTLFNEFWSQLERPARSADPATRRIELRLRDGAGSWRHAEIIGANLLANLDVHGIALAIRDCTERRAHEQSLAAGLLSDPLTRLPTNVLVKDRIAQALLRAGRRKNLVAVLYVRADGIHRIGPKLGARVVDELTLEAAARIRICLRPQDTVARLAQYEFLVLSERMTETAEVVALADSLARQFARPILLDVDEVTLDVRIGVAIGNPRRDSPDGLVASAEIACHQVGRYARARHVVFGPGMQSAALDRVELEGDLRQAEFGREMRVHYQPIVAIANGALVGLEALVRWNHPRHGLVPPMTFIPIAEATGRMLPIGAWLLEEACRRVAEWQAQCRFDPPLLLSVNLSAAQFADPALVATVQTALDRAALPSARLKLEVTEATLMADARTTTETLWAIKDLGVKVALDDFGAGYSSMAYLKQLPLDQLKIDRSFIAGIGQDEEDNAIVRAIIALGRSLGLEVTAEGIESAEQAALLEGWGCVLGQGFHFARPLDQPAATAFLAAAAKGRGRGSPAPRETLRAG